MALQRSWVYRRVTGMGKPLMELRRRVYRRSISKGVGVIEAIDEILTEVRRGEETPARTPACGDRGVPQASLRRR
jgi:hypothetical protein